MLVGVDFPFEVHALLEHVEGVVVVLRLLEAQGQFEEGVCEFLLHVDLAAFVDVARPLVAGNGMLVHALHVVDASQILVGAAEIEGVLSTSHFLDFERFLVVFYTLL